MLVISSLIHNTGACFPIKGSERTGMLLILVPHMMMRSSTTGHIMYPAKHQLLLAITLALVSIASGKSLVSRNKRMVNGNVAEINDWPFIASLKYSASSNVLWKVCSASLIARNWLITVAHCVKDINETTIDATDLIVRLRRRHGSWQTDEYEVSQIYTHPIINAKDTLEGIENDIALIRLKENAPSHMKITGIHQGVGAVYNCRSAGWGTTSQLANGRQDVLTGNYQISNTLRWINVPNLVAWNTCDFIPFIGQNVDMTASHKFFCGGETGVKDSNSQHGCIGDSGSPLICDGTSGPVLYGLLAGGNHRCIPGSSHMVFIDVFKHRQWINEVLHRRMI